MKSRLWSFILTIILLVALLPANTFTQAQNNCPPGLSGEDCDLFNNASDFLEEASSFNITSYTLNFQIRSDGDTTMLQTEGAGPILFEDGQIVGLELSFDPATLTTNEDELSGGGVLRINDEGVFLGVHEGDGELSWSGLASDLDIESSGASAEEMFNDFFESFGFDGENMGNALTVSRLEDETIDDRTVAVFVAEVDTAAFVRSPFFTELASQLLIGALGDQDIDPTLAAILVQTVLDRIASDFQENNIVQATFYIDPETLEFTYFALFIDLNIDLSFARGFSPDLDEAIPAGGLGIGVDLQVNISDYNEDFEIPTPEEYNDLSEDLGGLFSELLGGEGGLPFDLGFSPTDGTGVSAEAAEFSISLGDTSTGTLSTENEQDVYIFEGKADSTIQIAVRATDPDDFLDPIVELYNKEGTLLDQNDDADSPPAELELGYFDSYLTYTLEADG
ncbi:MAG: hypothetical protein CUN55_11140, partial [Phototrophicales bacterium]